MPHTHEFDCRACGAHLDSRQELDDHVRRQHPEQVRQGSSGGSSGGSQSSPPGSSNR